MNLRTMKSAAEVIATDLDLLSHQLKAEFDRLSGRSVLIAGGAGFLGYYLV
jgi:dTDP-glucose 4,6-dehydratase/UDP-glucuronate decarboxylase